MTRRAASSCLAAAACATLLLAGCTAGGASYVKSKFQDADQRIAQAVDGGFSEHWDIVVPPATPVLTIRASLLADQGIAFALRNPNGRLTTSLAYPGQTEVPEMTWIEMRRPATGTWRLGIDCERRCDFSFGFYLKDAVPRDADPPRAYDDATVRFSEDTDGTSTRVNEFHIPKEAARLSLRFALVSDDAFTFRLEDPSGHQRAATAFPSRALVDDARYAVMVDPPAGKWTFRAECRQGCAYGVGIYLE